MVGRGASSQGPFYDKLGSDLTTNPSIPAGADVLISHDNVYAPGGKSLIFFVSRMTCVYLRLAPYTLISPARTNHYSLF